MIAAIAASGLPPALTAYLEKFTALGSGSELRKALKADPVRLLENIRDLLYPAAAALGLPAEEILAITGFDYRNFAPDRLEAALAELRAVNILTRAGFTGIRFLPGGRRKEADIAAGLRGNRFFFEVRYLKKAAAFSGADEEKLLRLKAVCRKKLGQARASGRREAGTRAGVFLVADPAGSAPPPVKTELKVLAARVHAALGTRQGEHVCLSGGDSSAVFPPF